MYVCVFLQSWLPSLGSVLVVRRGRESVRGDSRLRRERGRSGEGVRRGRHGLAVWWPFQLNKQNTPKHDEPGSWKYVRVCYEVRFLTVSNSILQTVRKHRARSPHKQCSYTVIQNAEAFRLSVIKKLRGNGSTGFETSQFAQPLKFHNNKCVEPKYCDVSVSLFNTQVSSKGFPPQCQ